MCCRELVPDERSLSKDLTDQPFTFLFMISDECADFARLRMERYGIESPHVFMPWGTRSSTARVWRVGEWPKVFIIDQEGTIRFRSDNGNLRGPVLRAAVESLLGP